MSEDDSLRRIPPDPVERRVDRFAVGHDAFQFKFDFWQSASDRNEEAVTRIIADPGTAKSFSRSLRESLRDYDRAWHRVLPDATNRDET